MIHVHIAFGRRQHAGGVPHARRFAIDVAAWRTDAAPLRRHTRNVIAALIVLALFTLTVLAMHATDVPDTQPTTEVWSWQR